MSQIFPTCPSFCLTKFRKIVLKIIWRGSHGRLTKRHYSLYGIQLTFSTMKAVTPWDGFFAFSSVLAYTITTSASGPLVIQNLLPFRI